MWPYTGPDGVSLRCYLFYKWQHLHFKRSEYFKTLTRSIDFAMKDCIWIYNPQTYFYHLSFCEAIWNPIKHKGLFEYDIFSGTSARPILNTHKRHPISRPHGRAMVCPCEYFGGSWPRYNGIALYIAAAITAMWWGGWEETGDHWTLVLTTSNGSLIRMRSSFSKSTFYPRVLDFCRTPYVKWL